MTFFDQKNNIFSSSLVMIIWIIMNWLHDTVRLKVTVDFAKQVKNINQKHDKFARESKHANNMKDANTQTMQTKANWCKPQKSSNDNDNDNDNDNNLIRRFLWCKPTQTDAKQWGRLFLSIYLFIYWSIDWFYLGISTKLVITHYQRARKYLNQ